MSEKVLREHLKELLGGRGAHLEWKKALAGLPTELQGIRPPKAEHSLWELLEHARIAQWDILQFCKNSKHVSPDWPSGYWPASAAPPNAKAWNQSVKRFEEDTREMEKLVGDSKTDLYAKIPHGSGQTILREALLVADHNSYHLGQFVMVRRLLGAWPEA